MYKGILRSEIAVVNTRICYHIYFDSVYAKFISVEQVGVRV